MIDRIQPDRLYRRPAVEELTGLSTSSLYRGINAGWLPAPVQLGPRAVAWRGADLLEWMETRKSTMEGAQ